ncbi:hypothetical protein [Luteimonas sp. 3794]|uniref:hypothetical protein n=1 Tax=Luteimonas sp. 3794 TaxID=2817730 RepID=UPI00285E8832|nr:hypothetical protein [Luteimonas sp. 3794]MDR6992516.1 hypothetical protein [Luteimonas sp. 3794]
MSRSLVALCLAFLAMPALGTDPEPAAPPFVTAGALTDWLAHHPSALDHAPPHARALFLEALDFGPRGVRGFPYGELAFDLTTAELAEVQRLLLDEAMPLPGLEVEEARRLRAVRASGALAAPSAPVLATYREWRGTLEPMEMSGEAIDRLAAEQTQAGSDVSEDLRLLHRAALERATEFRDDARIHTVRALHARLQARTLASRQDHRALQRLLIVSGRIEDARTFTASVPDAGLPAVPRFDASRPLPQSAVRIWQIEDDDGAEPSLRQDALDLDLRIVVVSSPGCGFSRAAATAIPSDPELGPIFAQHAVWLIAPDAIADVAALREWNLRNPNAGIKIAVDAAQWPVALDTTPQFLVFRDGQLVEHVDGWRRDGSDRDALHAALARAGLLRSNADIPVPANIRNTTSGHR